MSKLPFAQHVNDMNENTTMSLQTLLLPTHTHTHTLTSFTSHRLTSHISETYHSAHEWSNEIPNVPTYYLAKPQPRERAGVGRQGLGFAPRRFCRLRWGPPTPRSCPAGTRGPNPAAPHALTAEASKGWPLLGRCRQDMPPFSGGCRKGGEKVGCRKRGEQVSQPLCVMVKKPL